MSGAQLPVGLGCTALAKAAAHHARVDGIGVYTEMLRRALTGCGVAIEPLTIGRTAAGAAAGFRQLPALGGQFRIEYLRAAALGVPFSAERQLQGRVCAFHAPDHLIPKLRSVPVIATVMDLIPLLHPEWASKSLRRLKNWAFSKSIHWADHIITISEFSKRDIVEHQGIAPERITVTPLGVDEAFFTTLPETALAQAREKYGLPEQFFLFLGTLQPRKNLDRVLEAHYKVFRDRNRGAVAPLVIIGKQGWGVDHLLPRIAELEQRGLVRWLDYVPRNDVIALLQSARALLFPSLYEGFGLPVVEAFASRCPVVTSTTTSLPEVAGSAGWLVDPMDVEALAEAIDHLRAASDREIAAKVEAGYERARGFTWDACARATGSVYSRYCTL